VMDHVHVKGDEDLGVGIADRRLANLPPDGKYSAFYRIEIFNPILDTMVDRTVFCLHGSNR
jgi:hypothetical protein